MGKEKSGVLLAVFAYLIWGILPLYWKSIDNVPSAEILVSRVVWAFLSTLLLILLLKNGRDLLDDLKSLWKSQISFWLLFLASLLISGNWFLYIWAVNNGFIVQASLGYYINPLVSVLLGVFFLKEKLSQAEKVAFTLAMIGVLILTFSYGQFPWLSFVLAISFAVYGLLKKQIKLDALRGLTIETFFIMPIALGYYIWLFVDNQAVFLHADVKTDTLLIFTGVATALPLVLFAKGAQRIPLYMIGFLQFIAPTMMLFIGVIVYKESFGMVDFLSFVFIWIGLIMFTYSKIYNVLKTRKAATE